ncbi:MAG: hypothetical protein JWP06_1037 [Candidatus Saccharibacteria bacterium]|nr:hypothetical protein [Candidatus Saccharibacteria bacterium]
MEFKKPNRYGRQRPTQTGSHPNDPTLTHPRATPRPAPSLSTTPVQSPHLVRPIVETKPNKPSLKSAVVSYTQQSLHDRKTLVILAVVILFLITAGAFIVQHNMTSNADDTSVSKEAVDSLEYQTILPEGKSITDLGGWKRVSPAKSDPVYAYIDEIGAVSINVSEQPLPQSFVGNTDDQVAELAKKFSATNKISAGDIKVYAGTSSKGPQSIIFTKNSLLILIKSQEKIDDAAWIKYIKSLS